MLSRLSAAAAAAAAVHKQVDVSRHMGQSLNVVHLVEVRGGCGGSSSTCSSSTSCCCYMQQYLLLRG
jgi:hypothetical protein